MPDPAALGDLYQVSGSVLIFLSGFVHERADAARVEARDVHFPVPTQRDRERGLVLIAEQLYELGYRGLKATSLRPKHVEALIARWRLEGLAVRTLKNRMTVMRWWAEKVGKQNVIARENSHYGIRSDVRKLDLSPRAYRLRKFILKPSNEAYGEVLAQTYPPPRFWPS